MAITINQQSFFSEIGKRANNEDNGGWNKGSAYIVCDGVGGNEKGEVASEIITSTLLQMFKENILTSAEGALQTVESKLTDYITQNPESMGMASTLVMTIVRPNGIMAAWVGDSRIYQFRKGKIVFRTTDHSWVNEALAAGILTEEEAVNHPKSNIITRAIQGNHKPVEAQEVWISDIQPNDMFLLCTDGVLETWTDEELSSLFAEANDTDAIANKLKQECAITSKDNNTAIVFRIETASGIETPSGIEAAKPKPEMERRPDVLTEKKEQSSRIATAPKANNTYLKLALVSLLFLSAFLVWKLFTKDEKPKIEPTTEETIPTDENNASEETNETEDKNTEESDSAPETPIESSVDSDIPNDNNSE
jgi:PPM family protein phosphatase